MSQFKKKLTAFTAMLAFLSLSSSAVFAALPSDVLGKTDNVSVTGGSSRLDVEINSKVHGAVGQVDWKNFNVPSGQQVNFGFSGLSQTIINRVLGGNQSQIFGKLTNSCASGGGCDSFAQTSKVILINPAGVLFGNGSMVDLNSFTVSTFDFNGAKNLKGMTQTQLDNYQTTVLNKLSPQAGVNGTPGKEWGGITFDSSYTTAFDDAATKYNNGSSIYNKGNTQIELNGTTFAHFDSNGNIITTGDPNKSVAIISDNIKYKDSIIRTGGNFNYSTAEQEKSVSNVRLITADGVTFNYLTNGYIDSYAEKATTSTARSIDIDNSGLAAGTAAIQSGDIHIRNFGGSTSASGVKIANSYIKGMKLVDTQNGDIYITSSNDISVNNSRLETANTQVRSKFTNEIKNTYSQNGGEIYLNAKGNVTVSDSLLLSAGADSTATSANAGAIRISADKTTTVDNTQILSKGNIRLTGVQNVNVSDSLVEAKNTVDSTKNQYVMIRATDAVNGINIDNSIISASDYVDIVSKNSNNALAGNVIIRGDVDASGNNKTIIKSGGNLSIQGANTKIDNATLSYDNITFYGNGTTGQNNVTVANSAAFDKTGSNDVTLETNGNFTLENATLKKGGSTYTLAASGTAGTPNQYSYTSSTTAKNADNVSVTSTQGDVQVVKGSNVNANNNINITSNTGNVLVGASNLTAGQNVNIDAYQNFNELSNYSYTSMGTTSSASGTPSKIQATNGNVDILARNGNVTINSVGGNATGSYGVIAGTDINIEATKGSLKVVNNSDIKGGNNTNITSYNTITFGSDSSSSTNIGSSSDILATNGKVNITSTNGDINAEKTTMANIQYGDRLTFNAKGSNNFTSEDSLKSVNVDYIAGTANNFTTKGDIQFVNSSLNSQRNNITTTEVGGDVILNNLTIKAATTNAADTVTTINAKGNITTKDVTKSMASDTSKALHSYPQSVNYSTTGSESASVLDVGKTKFIAKTNVPKDSSNPTNGSIILDVKNADNINAGIELTAENTVYDNDAHVNEGPEIHLNATDDKIAISRIVTDKLFLDANDKLYASSVALTPEEKAGLPANTPSKGYIEVRDYMGFNLDDDFTTDPTDFDYTGDYVEGTHTTIDGTLDTWEKHTIKTGNTNEDFILVYTRPKDGCPEPPPVDPINPSLPDDEADSFINQVRLPREQVEISKTSRISDNTVDQTSNIMSAAAKVDLAENASASYSDDDDDADD